MIKRKILYLLFLLYINTINAQSFQNGDLDGVISGNSCLPAQWQNVPYNDVNCLALQIGNDTPDLTSLTAPGSITLGGIGNPYSGNTFVSGALASNPPNFFQEGIMQTVNGFTVEKQYSIHFYQTVVKGNVSIDKSGSWAVYIDTILVGITSPTHSNEPVGSIQLTWEPRTISFTATATSHLIKFLPMDDDTNYFNSNTDTLGSLRMGIDSIGLEVITGVNKVNSNNEFSLFPNPNTGNFKLQYKGIITKPLILSITDVCGKLIDNLEITNTTTNYENTSLMNGLYFYNIRQGLEEVGRGKFLIVK